MDAPGIEDQSARRESRRGAGAEPVERDAGDRADAADVPVSHDCGCDGAGRKRRCVLPRAAQGGRAGRTARVQERRARQRAGSARSGARRMAAAAGELAPRRRIPEVIRIDRTRSPRELAPRLARLFELSARKIRSIEDSWRPEDGAPVFTVEGRYRGRGWTEWTQGF